MKYDVLHTCITDSYTQTLHSRWQPLTQVRKNPNEIPTMYKTFSKLKIEVQVLENFHVFASIVQTLRKEIPLTHKILTFLHIKGWASTGASNNREGRERRRKKLAGI